MIINFKFMQTKIQILSNKNIAGNNEIFNKNDFIF